SWVKYDNTRDMIFRAYNNGHSRVWRLQSKKQEIEEDYGSKFTKEGFVKLPLILSDMLNNLLEKVNFDNRFHHLRTVIFYTLDCAFCVSICRNR
ncbi:hypothetical protein BDF21DRAFT_340072, partial [Thamnidium elegans]